MDSFVNGVDSSSSKTRNYEREKGRERRNSQRRAPTNKIHIRNHTLLFTLYPDWVVVCTAQLMEGNTLFVATSMCRWVGYAQGLKPCMRVNGSPPPLESMASISVPCPKTILVAAVVGSNAQNSQPKPMVSFPRAPISNQNPPLSLGSTFSGFEWPNRKQQAVMKAQAQLNEVMVEKSSNSVLVGDSESKAASSEGKDEPTESKIPDVPSISAFMTQVSELVKLVDSRDITELQLKQSGCELIIRKKEALQQSEPAAPVLLMQPPYPHAMFPAPPIAAPAPAPASPSSAPALPPPAKASSSSHPPLKCPMAGTFYRSPAPGEPPFVKVGDKVQKGQVVCIIEAMKLMNEIEADQSGTITEIVAEDGKPVSVDTPLFVIAP
ncbi:hypothetical protein POTOM_060623 [Populus tomentosa]|uniref:Lipoyl-binding domain-containing protein n=1 Tax=Populus tomentosa TaxID=118781 RepID=A0A8X8BYU9_POPTO|nr:hypothetical protein POTOM_060623 [Populus tomentosa]